MNFNSESKLLHWIILLALALVWGSSFILMKKGLEVYPSVEVAGIRLVAAFIILLPFAIKRFSRIPRDKWKYLVLVGLGNAIPAFLFAEAQTKIDSSLAGILNTATPLFTLLVALLLYKYKTKWLNIAGIFIGLIGTVGLLWVSGEGNIDMNFHYGSYVIMATICYAFSLNIVKNNLREIDATSIAAFAFGSIGPFAIIYLFTATDFVTHVSTAENSIMGLVYIIILGVFGSALAVIVFNKLVKVTTVLFSSSVTYLIPVVAILWGVWDGEIFKWIYLLWIALILIGVFMVNKINN